MNLRHVWTEIFQKPAGRLLLFLLVGGIVLAFILLRRGPQPKPDNTAVVKPATQTKAYSFNEDISPPSRAQATPPERTYEQGGSRHTITETATAHSTDDLCYQGTID